MLEPTFEQKLAAQADFISKQADVTAKLAHKLDALVAAGQVQRVASRMDSADVRKEDDDARDAKLAKMIADAVSHALDRRDDKRRDRHALHEDDAGEVPPETEESKELEAREGEPEPMASDDDRLGCDDDRRASRADAFRRLQADENARLEAQYALDKAFQAVEGTRAPEPISGQSCRGYQTYCLKRLQRFSDDWRDIDLTKLDAPTFRLADKTIRADAIRVGSNSQEMSRFLPNGGLQREIIKTDPYSGQRRIEFVGPVDAVNGMFKPFELPLQRARFNMDIVKEAYRGK